MSVMPMTSLFERYQTTAGTYDELFEQAREAAWASLDAEEGRLAFLEKRLPNFQGR